jgi:hypothetical protein
MLLVPFGVARCGGRIGDLEIAGRLIGGELAVVLSPPLSLSPWRTGPRCQRLGRWELVVGHATPSGRSSNQVRVSFFVLFLFFYRFVC